MYKRYLEHEKIKPIIMTGNKDPIKATQASIKVDLILQPDWLYTGLMNDPVLTSYALVVDGGMIIDMGPQSLINQKYHAKTHHTLNNQILMPGLINAHCHGGMSLFRGLADDLPLITWLNEHIWPAESAFVDEAFVRDGNTLSIAEMIRTGVTCFHDMYFYPKTAAEVAIEMGVRCQLDILVMDVPTARAKTAEEYIQKGLADRKSFVGNSLISWGLGPQGSYTNSDESFKHIGQLAQQEQLAIQIHLHETETEINQSIASCGMRPIERLERLGLFDYNFSAVHMVHLLADEIKLIKEKHVHVVHCPVSNLKLASGIAPIDELITAGVPVCFGTDGAASQNCLDLWQEIKLGALLAKTRSQNPSTLKAETCLHMATLGAAKALGIDHLTGSLTVGKAADIISINLAELNTSPVYHPLSTLVYAVNNRQVNNVWVEGRQLLADGQFTEYDTATIMKKATAWQQKISDKVL